MSLKATLKDGILTVEIPVNAYKSASGKSTVIASSHGNQALPVLWEGKPVMLGLNAFVRS